MLKKTDILIFDADAGARKHLEQLVRKNLPLVNEVYSTGQKEIAKQVLGLGTINLVFLAAEMGEYSGFDFLLSLKEHHFEVVFIASDTKYAMQAIRHNAIDFLLKPVECVELLNAFNRFVTGSHENARRHMNYIGYDEKLNTTQGLNFRFSLKKGNSVFFVPPKAIYWCKAYGNYAKIYLEDETEYIVTKTLKELEQIIIASEFVRVHKSALVNLCHVIKMEEDQLVLKNNVRVKISRRRKDDILNLLSGKAN